MTTTSATPSLTNYAAAPMPDRFVDTSGWAAWADDQESFHPQAVVAFDEVWNSGGQLITTSYILAELTALFNRLRIAKDRQIQFFDDLTADPFVDVVLIDLALDASAWGLWRARPDKDWTLVDCASFVVMQRRQLTEAITSDRHFEQAGFVRLLK